MKDNFVRGVNAFGPIPVVMESGNHLVAKPWDLVAKLWALMGSWPTGISRLEGEFWFSNTHRYGVLVLQIW